MQITSVLCACIPIGQYGRAMMQGTLSKAPPTRRSGNLSCLPPLLLPSLIYLWHPRPSFLLSYCNKHHDPKTTRGGKGLFKHLQFWSPRSPPPPLPTLRKVDDMRGEAGGFNTLGSRSLWMIFGCLVSRWRKGQRWNPGWPVRQDPAGCNPLLPSPLCSIV